MIDVEPAIDVVGPSLRERLAAVWRSNRWWVIAVVALVTFVLGFLGFRELDKDIGFLDGVYLTLQLFTFQAAFVGEADAGAMLNIARFLAPVTTATALFTATAAAFREQLNDWRLGRIRDHVVVCGAGVAGARLVKELLERAHRVVVVEADPGVAAVHELQRAGALVVIGDARDAATLRRAAVGRASHMICLAGADDVNAEIALRAADLTGDRQGAALICLAHILDPDLCVLMRSEELASSHRTGSRLDFFSIEEQGARVMLREHSPFPLDDPEGSAAVPDVLVVGLNRLGQSLVAEMARHWRSHPMARGRPMTITAVDPDAERIVDRLRSRFPQLDHAATLVPVTVRLDPLDPAVVGSSHATTAYVCIDHETLAVRVALEVRRAIDADAAVVVELVRAAGLARLVERPSRIDHVAAFDLFDRTMRAELLLGGTYELLAQTIHEGYVEEQRRHGATEASNPSMAPWVRLAPTLRESNRDQAAHIGTKLAAIGQGIAPLTDWDAHEKGFTDEQVELLAEMEHERWVAQRVRDGWTPGPRDPEARTTPYLVDWDALAEETKELDRQAVRAIPELLSRAGYQIVSART